MRLGYIDRAEKKTVYLLPKTGTPGNINFIPETPVEYVKRFFREIEGLGNIIIVRVKGGRSRWIGRR